ncbi:hypothetical protein GDO78_019992 [Eleutherodactylus coqui]|uniref:Uncharacterized protein n=1 Tax=Eleutherodactylus coqui TaxID=57060 RepID=A0A8J6B763_ELECQ|nr:hypothetical protein GDO78_019992 [Eleutherodactylus coqui]
MRTTDYKESRTTCCSHHNRMKTPPSTMMSALRRLTDAACHSSALIPYKDQNAARLYAVHLLASSVDRGAHPHRRLTSVLV